MEKTFDCVEMKHRGAEALQALLSTMTEDEQTVWWRERTRELLERQARLREAKAANGPVSRD
jgi:hypothetical protein